MTPVALVKNNEVVAETKLKYYDTLSDGQFYHATGSRSSIQQKGYGTEMYMDILTKIYPVELRPEPNISEAAEALWASLRKRADVEVTLTGIKLRK